MHVTETIQGIVTRAPQRDRRTRGGTPVTTFPLATKRKALDGTDTDQLTWIIHAYGPLAARVLDTVTAGQSLIVTGSFFGANWRTPEGLDRTRIDVRALSLAPALAEAAVPVRFVLRGRVDSPPDLYEDGAEVCVDVDVRTSRLKRQTSEEVDVTVWPVSARGELARRIAATWEVGDEVVVCGDARPYHGKRDADMPQLEVWATSAGPELAPEL